MQFFSRRESATVLGKEVVGKGVPRVDKTKILSPMSLRAAWRQGGFFNRKAVSLPEFKFGEVARARHMPPSYKTGTTG